MLDNYLFWALDELSFAYLKKRIQPEADWKIPYFSVPKIQKTKFEDEEKRNLILFKYPSHYKHHPFLEYRSAFIFYFSIFGTLSLYWFIKALRNRKFFSGLIFGFFTVSSLIEAKYSFERVKDVRSIIVKDGKTLIIETFQDGFVNHEFDISEIKVANKNIQEVLIFVDKSRILIKKPLYYIVEPSPGCVFNQYLFDIVMKDRRYLRYDA